MNTSGRPSPWTIAAIFLWALALRLIYVHQISTNPYFDSPTMDPLYHDQWARAIAAGKTWLGNEPYFRAPFYPYFLAFVYRFLDAGYLLPRLLQAIAGSAACVVVYLIARRTFNERTAVLAGLVAGAYWMLIYFDGELLINVFENLFNLLFLWLVLRAMDSDRTREWVLAGAMLGLSAIARPTILTMGAALVPWLWWSLGWRGFARRIAAVGVGALLLILPVTIRNAAVGGDFVPIAWQGGINFYIGNHEGADGWSATAPELPLDWWGGYNRTIGIPEEAAGRKLQRSAVSDYWFARGMEYLKSDPAGGVTLWLRKFALFWTSYEFGNNQDVYFFKRYASLLTWPLPHFALVAPLGLAGMILLTRDRRRALLTLFAGVYMFTIVAFFVCDKLRLPVVPILIVFASALVTTAIEKARMRRQRWLVVAAALLVPMTLLVNRNVLGIERPDFAQSHASVGSVYLNEGRHADAEREFRAAIALNPQFPSAHLNLGVALSSQGKVAEAADEYRREIALGREDPRAYSNLGYLLQQQGDTEQAIVMYRQSLEIAGRTPAFASGTAGPDAPTGSGSRDPEVLYNLASSLVRAGRADEAEPLLREVIAAQPDNLRALNNLAVVFTHLGREDEAIATWEAILTRDPGFEQARKNLDAARTKRRDTVPIPAPR